MSLNIPKTKIICLTPIKNEAWILDRFLTAASLWADHIIIADQMSTDGSRVIAKKYPKVILIDNPSDTFNEPERQKMLIHEARKIQGPRLLITLDADEMFTPNILTSLEWKNVLNAEPGTIFKFQWANFCPDLKNMWFGLYFPWGYMDDGQEHSDNNKIHTFRIPLPIDNPIVKINEIKVIHLQYTNWERMQSKHRWYQCYEKIHCPEKSAVDIFRMYHHMYAIPPNQIIPIPAEWIQEHNKRGIDITIVHRETKLWWDELVLNYIEQNGAAFFKKINIWDTNWKEKAKLWGRQNMNPFSDPRNIMDKLIQLWLIKTQNKYPRRVFKFIDNKIIRTFWGY
jgi:hypothetical protein